MTTLPIRLRGEGLRGPGNGESDGLHLGIQRKREVVSVVPRSTASATFTLDVDVVSPGDGVLDFRGPFVHGKRGDRFLYLSWGEVARDGSFGMVQRTKIRLGFIDPSLVERALDTGATLQGTLELSDQRGCPRSGTLKPEHIAWEVASENEPD